MWCPVACKINLWQGLPWQSNGWGSMFDPCSKNEDPACYEVPELIYDERLTCMHSCSVMSNPLQSHGLQSTKLLCSWISPSRNTGMGCHFLLQGIFPTQRSNPRLWCLLHWEADSLPLSYLGRPDINTYHIFIHSSVDGHLDYFCILAVVNSMSCS